MSRTISNFLSPLVSLPVIAAAMVAASLPSSQGLGLKGSSQALVQLTQDRQVREALRPSLAASRPELASAIFNRPAETGSQSNTLD